MLILITVQYRVGTVAANRPPSPSWLLTLVLEGSEGLCQPIASTPPLLVRQASHSDHQRSQRVSRVLNNHISSARVDRVESVSRLCGHQYGTFLYTCYRHHHLSRVCIQAMSTMQEIFITSQPLPDMRRNHGWIRTRAYETLAPSRLGRPKPTSISPLPPV